MSTYQLARQAAQYLGINPEIVKNEFKSSHYLIYNSCQIRISDHMPNERRLYAAEVCMGYKTICIIAKNWEEAKRQIDVRVLGILPDFEGKTVAHPKYGSGLVLAYDKVKDVLSVDFDGKTSLFFGTSLYERGWIID